VSSYTLNNVSTTTLFEPLISKASSTISSRQQVDKSTDAATCNCFENITKSLNILYTGVQQTKHTQPALLYCLDFLSCSRCSTDYFSLLLVISVLRLAFRNLEDLIIPSAATPSEDFDDVPQAFVPQALQQCTDILSLLGTMLGRSGGESGGKLRKFGALEPTETDLAYVRGTINRQEGMLELLKRMVMRRQGEKE
jgi:hypothetical protein